MENWSKNFSKVFNHNKLCTECTVDHVRTVRGTRKQHLSSSQLKGVRKSNTRKRDQKNCSFSKFVAFYKEQRLVVLERTHRNLFEAIYQNKSIDVGSLLTNGCDPNAEGRSGPALHVAVTKGFQNVVRVLLEQQADPNKRDLMGNTPLHLAVHVPNSLHMVQLLIRYGADVHATDRKGRMALDVGRSRLTVLKQHCRNGIDELAETVVELDRVTEYPILTDCYKLNDEFMTRAEFEEFQRSLGTSPELEEAAGVPDMMKLTGNIYNLNIE